VASRREPLEWPSSSDASVEVPQGPLATPRESVDAFTAALGHGDLETASNCLAVDVTLITPDATAVTGRRTVRDILAQLVGNGPMIDSELAGVIEAGPVAFAQQRWRIRSEVIAGTPHLQTLTPSFVLLRLGTRWRLAILAPWGWAGSSVAPSPGDSIEWRAPGDEGAEAGRSTWSG
jgi:ketosteroid isomerase-like protein